MKFAIIVFPGSNCDHDAYKVIENIDGATPEFVWHKDCLLYTSPSPRDRQKSRMPSSA